MTGGFQFAKRLKASGQLLPATGVMEPKLFAYQCGQCASVGDFHVLKQPADVLYA
jgi:hypothetical protein